MKNAKNLAVFVCCFTLNLLSAQNVPLKYGIYKISDGGSVYNSGACGSYSYTNPVTDYWFKPGMTLYTVEDNFCGGIRRDWSKQTPATGPCSISLIDSTHFRYAFFFTLRCLKDNTSIMSLGHGLVSFYEGIPVDPVDPDPDQPFSIYVSNKIKGFSPEEQLLWSGTAEETAPVIKICADGSRATWIRIIKYNPDIPASSIQAKLESDPTGSHPEYYGSVSMEELNTESKTIVYKHPGYLPPSLKSTYRTDKIIISYGGKTFNLPLEIYRAPVVMVHGLWSNGGSFLVMKNKLISEKLYPDELIYLADYQEQNGASFATNGKEVPENINIIFNICRGLKYSAGKVDIIGHSMGGLLTRYYLESDMYRDDIHRIITINTPHSGTQLANFLTDDISPVSAVARFIGEPIVNLIMHSSIGLGAVRDLAVNSDALNKLNFQALYHRVVPSHTITTRGELERGFFLNTILYAVSPLVSLKPVDFLENLYYSQQNDVIVPVPSQTGGLPLTSTTSFSNQVHMESTENGEIISEVIKALCTDPQDPAYYCQTGFAPVAQSSHFKKAFINIPPDIIPGSIKINNPLRNEQFNPGSSVPVNITSGSGIQRIILAAVNLPDNTFITDSAISGGTFPFRVPSDAFGKLTLFVMGYKANSLIGFDTLSVSINQNSITDSLTLPENIIYVHENKTRSVSPIAWFKNGFHHNVGILPEIQYQLTDTTYARYVKPNLITGKKPGITVLTIQYNTVMKQFPVIVLPEDTSSYSLTTSLNESRLPGSTFNEGGISDFRVYPNPSAAQVFIHYNLVQSSFVSLIISDIYGRKVAELVNTGQLPGEHQCVFNGSKLPSGFYFFRLKTGNKVETRKFLLRK